MRTPDPHRALVAEHVAATFAAARERGATGRETRRLLRAKLKALSPLLTTRARWYRAVVKAAGCLLMDLEDCRRPRLFDIGPRTRKVRT